MVARRPGRARGRTRADGAWKRVLTDLLPDGLAFTVPELHAAVDWTVPPLSLDKEFAAMARGAAIGPRVADHLVQLRLRSGDVTWLVLHVEVQGRPQDDFAARMFTYYALIHLRLWRRREQRQDGAPPLILGLALLTDEQAAWRPGPYEAREFGQGIRYDYWTIKLLDWREREAALLASDNPFALVVAAWLGWQAARGRTERLLDVARPILRRLRRSEFDDAEAGTVLAFLDQVIALPATLEERLLAELASEEGVTVPQVTSRFERQGMRKGRQEAYLETALMLLERKLGPLDEETLDKVRALDGARLLALSGDTLDFTERADLDRWLATANGPGG